MLEEEVRLYNELFLGDTQPARLLHLRNLAVHIMTELDQFQPLSDRRSLNGTAGAHSDIHLPLFTDSAKDVEIYLLNKNIDFDIRNPPLQGSHDPVETLSFIWQQEGIHLALYETDDLRGAIKKSPSGRQERADIHAVRALITQENTQENGQK